MTSGADALLEAGLTAALNAALDVPRPPTALPGWLGLCAGEYARAAHELWEALDGGIRALQDALAAVRAA